MKITNKISLSFFIAVLIPLSIIMPIIYYMASNGMKNAIFAHLATTAQSRTHHIETFLEMQKSRIIPLSQGIIFEDLLHANKQDPHYADKLDVTIRRLSRTEKANEYIYEVFVLNAKGIAVTSSDRRKIGLDRSSDAYFLEAKSVPYIKDAYYSKITGKPAIAVSAPIIDTETKKFLGVVVAEISLNELNRITTDRTGLGKTGEVYLVNKQGLMITPSRFIKDTFLKLKVDTENTRKYFEDVKKFGTEEHEHDTFVFDDYRGVRVLGIHSHMLKPQWALLAEIDESEALAPVAGLKTVFTVSALFALMITWFVGTFVSRIISRPIHKLRKGAEIIGQGNLDYKIAIDTKDELGQLSQAFNKMTADLKNRTTSIDELNKEIAIRRQVEEELQESKNQLKTVLNSVHAGIVTINVEDHVIVDINSFALKLIGASREDVIGRVCHKYICPAEKGKCPITDLGQKFDGSERRLLTAKGEFVPILKTVTSVTMKGSKYLIESFVDISRLKQTEEDLRKAKEEAEDANRAKSSFLASMSHEIRTPMNAVIGMADLLSDTPLTDMQKEYLDMLTVSANNLLDVINDVLDMSKIEAGHLEIEKAEFDLRDVVELVAVALGARASKKDLELLYKLKSDVPRYILGDSTRLRQILINLASNSIKFTEKGEIVVNVEILERNGDDIILHFSVKDTGIGISKERLSKIFESFTQADSSTTRKYGGTGLGLTISKQLVEKMNGKIWVESEMGKGSTFHFTIRSLAVEKPEEKKETPEKRAIESALKGKPLEVLLAEDNIINQKVAVRILEKQGWQVTVANNGKEAVEISAKSEFDLILMDVQMPEMDGLEATVKIRKREEGSDKHIPIIALTAHAFEEDKKRCLDAGMDRYATKPIKIRELFAVIEEVLEKV